MHPISSQPVQVAVVATGLGGSGIHSNGGQQVSHANAAPVPQPIMPRHPLVSPANSKKPNYAAVGKDCCPHSDARNFATSYTDSSEYTQRKFRQLRRYTGEHCGRCSSTTGLFQSRKLGLRSKGQGSEETKMENPDIMRRPKRQEGIFI